MHSRHRRTFFLQVIATGSVLTTGARTAAAADALERVTEADPYARSMGFRLDTTQVDQAKYPRHDVSQQCNKCQLYDGKPGEPLGPCSFYGGRLVSTNGWCRNFKVRKA